MAVCDSFLFRAVHYYLDSVSCDVKLMPNPSEIERENNTFLFIFLLPCCDRKQEFENCFLKHSFYLKDEKMSDPKLYCLFSRASNAIHIHMLFNYWNNNIAPIH